MQSSSVLLMKLEGTVLVGTLLGTVVTVLVAWTKFRYKVGNPSLGTRDCVDGHAAMLGTVVTVLVVWTEFRYEVGSPSLGTKLVLTIICYSTSSVDRVSIRNR